MKNLFTVIAFSLLSASTSFAGTTPKTTEGASSQKDSRLPQNTNLVAGLYPQAIDHAGKLPGQTFNQRYWIDSQYAKTDTAPVIYHICGEGDATDGYFLNDNAIEWAKTMGAHLVYLEHRYYGKSQPFSDLSTSHLQYLTLQNVLEDLATFQKWISTTQNLKGKWISVGGSYSGTLSALYRQAHPELVVGALASSAPMISGIGEDEGSQSDVTELSSTDVSNDSGDRPWVYQSCTKFGFWQAMGATPGSTLMSPSAWLCQQLFGNAPHYDSKDYNAQYDAPFISNSAKAPSKILFTYGSNDVWTALGLTQQNNANKKITIQVIQGAGHHYDLNAPSLSDNAAVKSARATFLKLAQDWLK